MDNFFNRVLEVRGCKHNYVVFNEETMNVQGRNRRF